jgi:hypothetical protein
MNILEKKIRIPKILHEIHGEETNLATIICTYLAGIIVAAVFFLALNKPEIPFWKTLVLSVVMLDVGAGAVANFSYSTNKYYEDNHRLRLPFILIHIFHPAIMAWLMPKYLIYFLFCYLFTATGAIIVNAIRKYEIQNIVASLLVASGITISIFCLVLDDRILYTFGCLFMIKIILGFSVRRVNRG